MAPHLRAPKAVLLLATAALAVALCSCEATVPAGAGRPLAGPLPFDQPPRPVSTARAVYPDSARQAGITGTVALRLLVDETGRVLFVDVSQGVTGLTDAAVAAARRWTFHPARKNGKVVRAWYEADFRFPS